MEEHVGTSYISNRFNKKDSIQRPDRKSRPQGSPEMSRDPRCPSLYTMCFSSTKAAVTKYGKLNGLNKKIYCLTVWYARSLRSRCWHRWLLLYHVSPLPCGDLLAIFGLKMHYPLPLLSFSHDVISLCMTVFVSKCPPFYRETSHIGAVPTIMTSFNLITSVKCITLNQVTF